MENNKFPPINKVQHVNSTKSEQLKNHSYEHELSFVNRFTIQQKKDEPKMLVAPYDERKQWCRYIQNKIKEANEQIERRENKYERISWSIQKKQREHKQLNQSLSDLEYKLEEIDLSLKEEKDKYLAIRLKKNAQFYVVELKKTKENLQILIQQLQDLKGQRQFQRDRIKEIKRYINQNQIRLMKEKYPRLPKINPKDS